MSKNSKPVMSHDPLADLDDEAEDAVLSDAMPSQEDRADAGVQDPDSGSVLKFDSSLTIADVGAFYETCFQALDASGPLLISGKDLEAIDGAGMQMVSACVREAISQGREVRWQDVPDAISRASRIMGLDEALGLDRAALN